MTNIIRTKSVKPVDSYPRGIAISKHYIIMVKAADDKTEWDRVKHQTTVYRFWPDYIDPKTLPKKHGKTSVHTANVDTAVKIKARIELIGNAEINSLKVKPSRIEEISSSLANSKKWIEFEVDPHPLTRSILIEINPPANDSEALDHGLLLFVNPVSRLPEGNILRLPSGIVNEESEYMDDLNRILISEDSPYDGIYIPGDTIVDGRIEISKSPFSVTGRGIITGSRWPFVKTYPNWREGYPEWISPDKSIIKSLLCSNLQDVDFHSEPNISDRNKIVYFEGVTIVHPYHFCIAGADLSENLKAFGWRFSSDGIHGYAKKGCFTRVNDDAVYINMGFVEDCTFWGMVNGAIFQLGWNLKADRNEKTYAKRCDIVRGEWDIETDEDLSEVGKPKNAMAATPDKKGDNRGIVAGTYRSAVSAMVRNKCLSDIRIDCAVERLIYLGSRSDLARYENFQFKNIRVNKKPNYFKLSNHVACSDKKPAVTFKDFYIENSKVENVNDIEPVTGFNLDNIEFL